VRDGLRWIAPVLDVESQWPEMLPRLLNPAHVTKGRLLLGDEEFADRVAALIQKRGPMSSKQIADVLTAKGLTEGNSSSITNSVVFALKRSGRFEDRGKGWIVRSRPQPSRPPSKYFKVRTERRRREMPDRLPPATTVERLPAPQRQRDDPLETYYTIREVAEHLNVHQNTVRQACWSGELAYRRVGRSLRILKSAFEKWLSGRR
jgi:excisionase family DNA binding protein